MDTKALVCAHRRMILTFEAVLVIRPLWTALDETANGRDFAKALLEVEW
jgi:hypothetical protein